MAAQANLKPGWLRRDTKRAALAVARQELVEAEREERQLNDALADAHTRVNVARVKLSRLERES